MELPKRLFDFPYYQLKKFPLQMMMTSKLGDQWKGYSTAEFVEKMNLVSAGLLKLGIRPGDKIALITAGNRCEWNIIDAGILQIGAIDVPIYPTMTESDYEYILNHSESKLCFVSNEELYKKVQAVSNKVPSLQRVYSFDQIPDVPNWSEVMDNGKNGDTDEVKRLAGNVKEEDMATIIYTSGTTGLPKGVMLSHKNIASNAIDCEERLPVLKKGESRSLSFLPCCHIYERMLHYLYMANGVSIYLTGMDAIKDDLNIARPHIFTAVPRLLEKVYDGILAKGMANNGIKLKLFKWAHDLALEWQPDGRNGGWYSLRLSIARKLVFSKVKEALGLTEIGGIASGSAALQARLARFYNGAGIPVLEGYGLTETSPVISVNAFRQPGMMEPGSVGRVIRNVEVKIGADGEILCKGPNVMIGYYKEPQLTAEVLRDGWFHTGDIGEIKNGLLYITDRKKEIFKTSGGKYVAPQAIENALKEIPYIEQCMVIGEGEKFPSVLIVPEYVSLSGWAKKNNVPFSSEEELLNNKVILELVQSEINKKNERFGKWEQPKAFRFIPHPFSIERGEITPTLKLKRKAIRENYKELIEDIYRRETYT
ncbi:MAG: long-chain fatty acid--CoA ligase [Crocinitomicaceae bacterium]|nr:long-chain fatty acid--CoA ligase [Crocinitomicaceae bacterium]